MERIITCVGANGKQLCSSLHFSFVSIFKRFSRLVAFVSVCVVASGGSFEGEHNLLVHG